MAPRISVVIPVFNEEDILGELYRRLEKVFVRLEIPYEIIFVNDGSRDSTLARIKEIAAKNRSVKALDFSRNFGLQPAYSAGIDHASGEAVIVMDGDLQDPPELIPQLIAEWKKGYDVVYTVKTKRKEALWKRFAFAAFYRILASISTVEMPLDAGSFCIMSRRVVEVFKTLPERNRLVSGIRAWVGFRQTGIAFERDARFSGEPRQTLMRLMKMATDGLFAFSTMPLRVATLTGFAATALGLILILFATVARYSSPAWMFGGPYRGLLLPVLAAVVFLGGVQLVFIGMLGEYVGRIFEEVKNRPLYVVRDKVNFDPSLS